jgi:hypothetical protein
LTLFFLNPFLGDNLKRKIKRCFSKIKQRKNLLKQRFILLTPYKKLFKQEVFGAKMRIFWGKRCASFTIKDVHLFKICFGIEVLLLELDFKIFCPKKTYMKYFHLQIY